MGTGVSTAAHGTLLAKSWRSNSERYGRLAEHQDGSNGRRCAATPIIASTMLASTTPGIMTVPDSARAMRSKAGATKHSTEHVDPRHHCQSQARNGSGMAGDREERNHARVQKGQRPGVQIGRAHV